MSNREDNKNIFGSYLATFPKKKKREKKPKAKIKTKILHRRIESSLYCCNSQFCHIEKMIEKVFECCLAIYNGIKREKKNPKVENQ